MHFNYLIRLSTFLAATSVVSAIKLNVTAIGAHDGASRFECWELNAPFMSSNQSGLVNTKSTVLGDVSKMTYNVIPPGFDGGLHPAPSNQWVVLLSGVGVISLPDNSSTTLTTKGGEFGILFATDTADLSKEGHGSFFPGPTETIGLQIPTKNNEIPEHRVLYDDKPCAAAEITGLRALAVDV